MAWRNSETHQGRTPQTRRSVDMKYLLTFVPFLALIAVHDAWRSFECPLLLNVAVLVCIIIKNKSNEQSKKESD